MMAHDPAFKALADPTRRAVLRMLKHRDMTAGEIAERFPVSAPSMSHHFGVLKQADLIFARRDGQQIIYSLNTTVVQDLLAALFDIFSGAATPQEVLAIEEGRKS